MAIKTEKKRRSTACTPTERADAGTDQLARMITETDWALSNADKGRCTRSAQNVANAIWARKKLEQHLRALDADCQRDLRPTLTSLNRLVDYALDEAGHRCAVRRHTRS